MGSKKEENFIDQLHKRLSRNGKLGPRMTPSAGGSTNHSPKPGAASMGANFGLKKKLKIGKAGMLPKTEKVSPREARGLFGRMN